MDKFKQWNYKPLATVLQSSRRVLAEGSSYGPHVNVTHGSHSTTDPITGAKKAAIVGFVIGVSVLVFVIVFCVICVKRNTRRTQKMMKLHRNEGENCYSSQSSRSRNTVFSYKELEKATDGFSQENYLGQGGFGFVYRGKLLNGTAVAVKSLKSGSQQGESEFNAEVDIISQVHHRNLVSLVGFCTAPGKKLLVYKYAPNKTLEYHLHGNPNGNLNWPKRLRIAIGSAKGLAYLHNDCQQQIIHRNIKSGNILLDDDFEPKVSDFGLEMLKEDKATHVSTSAIGTLGYISPDYYENSQVAEKTDVFSFGVMLVEIITGKRPASSAGTKDNSYTEWAKPLLKCAHDNGQYNGLVDARLGDDFNFMEMARMVACALASIRDSPSHRPKMIQVAHALEGIIPTNSLTVRSIMEKEIVTKR